MHKTLQGTGDFILGSWPFFDDTTITADIQLSNEYSYKETLSPYQMLCIARVFQDELTPFPDRFGLSLLDVSAPRKRGSCQCSV